LTDTTPALDMAIRNRRPTAGGVVHADHGTQFTSWVRRKDPLRRVLPSSGTIGQGLDNAMMESFWSSIQIELLDRQKWKTRVGLANAIFDYIEIFHNRQRRHSALGYRTPIEYELSFTNDTLTAVSWPQRLEPKSWVSHLSMQQTEQASCSACSEASQSHPSRIRNDN
jgi:putative transposase